jgi:serine/threonine protein kinase
MRTMFVNLFKSKKREEEEAPVIREKTESPRNEPARMRLSDIEMMRTLGTGSFGRVKFAKSKIDGQYYAVKYMKKHEIIKLKQGMHYVSLTAQRTTQLITLTRRDRS